MDGREQGEDVMSEHAPPFDVVLAIGAVVLGGANIALFASAGPDWVIIAIGVVGVAMLVAITARFYWRYSGGAGLVLFVTGWVIVALVGSVLSAFWGGSDGPRSSSPSGAPLEWFASLTVFVTSVPLILCGFGLLVSVVASRVRGGPYGETPATS